MLQPLRKAEKDWMGVMKAFYPDNKPTELQVICAWNDPDSRGPAQLMISAKRIPEGRC
jgi:hypothetical protein